MNKKRLLKQIIIGLIGGVILSLIIASLITSYHKYYTGDISQLLFHTNVKNDYPLATGDTISYQAYKQKYAQYPAVNAQVPLLLDSSNSKHYLAEGNNLYTSDRSYLEWQFNIPTTGLYSLFLRYRPLVGDEDFLQALSITEKDHYRSRTNEIQREIKINGVLPFKEAYQIKLARIWTNHGTISINNEGDEVRPPQIEAPQSNALFVGDFTNLTTYGYKFYLPQGANKISIQAISEPCIIEEIFWGYEACPLPYQEALVSYQNAGYEIYKDKNPIRIEGEQMLYKSSPVLIPLSDTTSSKIYPYYKGTALKLNIMGYFSWRLPGYWVEYKFKAPKKGLYALSFFAKQDIKSDTFSTREIIINGRVPFLEASHVPFLSSGVFTTYHVGSKKKPYLFPLEEGDNIIRMRTSLSNIGDILNLMQDSVDKLNDLYLETIISVPEEIDDAKTFDIINQVQNFKPRVKEIIINLENLIKHYEKIVARAQSRLASVKTMVMQLKRFASYPNGITKELNFFKTNIAALGSWLNLEREQPLTVDAFCFHAPNQSLPRVRENIFERLGHEILKFFASFKNIQNKRKNQVTVWVTSGRDNAHIMRRLLNDPHSGLKNIKVNLELVNPQVLLKATFAKRAPDVAVNVPEGFPCDFAFRDVLVDLSSFDDFANVKTRYHHEAFTTFTFNKGIYALPETQTFPVLFYRKDVFKKLGLSLPGNNMTYLELENIIETLQNKKMNFYLESPLQVADGATTNVVSTGLFATILLQHKGQFYNQAKTKTALLSDNAKQAFIQYCEYFSNRGIEMQANFLNRFRAGEMPAGIASYELYNQLAVFAPEISGKWAIAPVPSFLLPSQMSASEDDYRVATNINQATILFKKTNQKQAAWEFIKWWTSDEIQLLYGRELETTVGAAARYMAANINTAEQIPWPRQDLAVIQLTRTRARGIPQVPGGYMTTRQIKNAFLATVRDNKGSIDVLYNYAQEIDLEIAKKRQEFRLS